MTYMSDGTAHQPRFLFVPVKIKDMIYFPGDLPPTRQKLQKTPLTEWEFWHEN